jgi:hypothetical protein
MSATATTNGNETGLVGWCAASRAENFRGAANLFEDGSNEWSLRTG